MLSFMPRPVVEGNLWPPVVDRKAAGLLAIQYQLERTQWLSPEELRELQFRQLGLLLEHAYAQTPHYRRCLAKAGYAPGRKVTADMWARIPLLTRADLQKKPQSLRARTVPPEHGKVGTVATSGSTGKPIRTLSTDVTQFFWTAFTLRDHLWHRRDFSAKLAVIRFAKPGEATYPEGYKGKNWGVATAAVMQTGPAAMLTILTPIEEQAEWLARHDPAYLLSYPSNLLRLAQHCRENGIRVPALREVRAVSEIVRPELREAVREAWGVKVTDMYSTQEAGYLALQCPEHEHYHVQSESVMVEVLDEEGRACGPGKMGRVVVTSLHNFAMPLIRYEVGDYAVAGGPCDCGRSLPVLSKILGRERNLVSYPSGEQRWPMFGEIRFNEVVPIRQYQLVQKSLDEIEVRFVPARKITPREEDELREVIVSRLGHPFRLKFVYLDEIPRGPGGKYEDFRSEVRPEDLPRRLIRR